MLKAEALGAAQSIEIALGASSVRNVKDALRMKHNITDDPELLIAAVARQVAHHHQCSLAAATRQIRSLSAEARERRRYGRTGGQSAARGPQTSNSTPEHVESSLGHNITTVNA
jgi:hypothetical protein